MKFFIVLIAILKYALIFILFLILLVLVLALILMISPIRYKLVINYKNNNLYYNVDVTYLGKIVGFKLKGVKDKFKAYVRLFHKKVYIKSDEKQNSKKKSTSSNKKQSSKSSDTNGKKPNQSQATKVAKESVSEIPLDVVQKATPTTTLEEAIKTSNSNNCESDEKNANTLHNSQDKTEATQTLDDNYAKQHVGTDSKKEDNATNKKATFNKEKNNDVDDEKQTENFDKTSTTDDDDSPEEKLSFIENIKKIINDINFYIESYKTYPYRDKLFKKFKKIFTNLRDALFPKVFDVSGQMYISNPATTGQLIGFLYMLHGLNHTFNVSVDGDFETEQNDFTALISGRIIIIKLVAPVVSFVWLGLKAEAKRRKITRFKLIKILIKNDKTQNNQNC